MTFTHALATNRYGEADLIVSTSAANGTHTTLASAMSAAVSGQTIFLRDSVTENVTITAGVNISAWSGGSLNVPTITGTLTMTAAGTSTISGLKLTTNSAAIIAVTGSAASILNVNNCYLNCSNNSGITFSSSDAGAIINIRNCAGDLGTTGINYFAHSSSGNLNIYSSNLENSGSSLTANTVSAGTLTTLWTRILNQITTSGTGAYNGIWTLLGRTSLNQTVLTAGGSGGGTFQNGTLNGGTASAASIGVAGYNLVYNNIVSSNTNAVTGAGTVNLYGNVYTSTSLKVNTTTETGGTIHGVTQGTAPSAGFLGERITASATSVATTSGAAKTITSISLTAGIWDISGISYAVATGGAATMTAAQGGISTTDNAQSGTAGVDFFQVNAAGATTFGIMSTSVSGIRATLSATSTTYYYVCLNVYASTTCPTNARISATRVG